MFDVSQNLANPFPMTGEGWNRSSAIQSWCAHRSLFEHWSIFSWTLSQCSRSPSRNHFTCGFRWACATTRKCWVWSFGRADHRPREISIEWYPQCCSSRQVSNEAHSTFEDHWPVVFIPELDVLSPPTVETWKLDHFLEQVETPLLGSSSCQTFCLMYAFLFGLVVWFCV